jgi:hypothetical protein
VAYDLKLFIDILSHLCGFLSSLDNIVKAVLDFVQHIQIWDFVDDFLLYVFSNHWKAFSDFHVKKSTKILVEDAISHCGETPG